MRKLPASWSGSKSGARRDVDPLLSPELYLVDRFDDCDWNALDPMPVVTVAVGERTAAIRFTDSDPRFEFSEAMWSRADRVARRVAVLDDDLPLAFHYHRLHVEVPLAMAERVAKYFLTLVLPTGRVP